MNNRTKDYMQRSISEALEYCSATGVKRLSLIIPATITTDEVEILFSDKRISELYLPPPTDLGLDAPGSTERIKKYANWLNYVPPYEMPACIARANSTPVVLANRSDISTNILLQSALRGKWVIICRSGQDFLPVNLLAALLWQFASKILEAVQKEPDESVLKRVYSISFRQAPLRRFWKKIFRRGENSSRGPKFDSSDEPDFATLMNTAKSLEPYDPVPRRIIHVSEGLGPGGAERQIVETLRGLKQYGFHDLQFVGLFLETAANLKFHAASLEQFNISCQEPTRRSIFSKANGPHTLALLDQLNTLPDDFEKDVLTLAALFRVQKPEIIHAWQDAANLKVGLAATIAGAQKIILSCRSMNPTRFHFYRSYQRSAYRALASNPNVIILHNSEIGAKSYAEWLQLPVEDMQIVRNGFDREFFRPTQSVDAIRRILEIDVGVPVVGSVFRLVEEKRPYLWLAVAAEVLKCLPHCLFVIVGEGPMRDEILSRVKTLGLTKNFRFPGASHDIAGLLSIMDIVLLTSRVEGLPNVLIEAQMMGVPVVSSNVGGVSEAILQTESDCLVDSEEPKMFADPIVRMLTNCNDYDSESIAVKRFAEKRFSKDRMIAETLAIYDIG